MIAQATKPTSSIVLQTGERRVELAERFGIRVLGPSERTVDAAAIKLVGRRLIVQIGESLPAGEPVRIDAPDSFLLGEVLGCWRERGAIFAAIEIEQALTGLSDLARWMGERGPMDVRLSA